MKIGIVGAGIIGTLTAYEFARRGHHVKVFDREPATAMRCSKANGAQISVCNSHTWNTWANVLKGLKWMTKKDAPFLIRPSFDVAKMKWLAGFLRHTMNGSHLSNTIATIELGKASSARYDEIIVEEGLQFDQSKCGLLHVYTNTKSLDQALEQQDLFEDHGVEWKPIERDGIIKLDPALETFKDLKGGILTSTDWTGDAHLFCEALRKTVERKFDARFFFNSTVSSRIRTNQVSGRHALLWEQYRENSKRTFGQLEGGFDHIIICNGHEIVNFARQVRDDLNVFPVKGYSITIDGVDEQAPRVSLLDDEKKIVCARLGNRLRVAGTAELDGTDDSIREDRIRPLVRWVNENFPGISTAHREEWACLRPMNSNMMPIVRESSLPGVWYHGGHGHLGWTLGAGTTDALVKFILK